MASMALKASEARQAHRRTGDDAGCLELDRADFGGLNGSQAVQGLAQGVDHAAHDAVADGHGVNLAGTLDRVAFLNTGVRAQQGDTNVVLFQVEHHAHVRPPGNSSSSMAMTFSTPCTRAMPSPT